MIEIFCAVHDRQLNAFMRPFVAQSPGQAIRSFRDEVNREGSEMNRHPEDYTLYRVGVWDQQTGEIAKAHPAPEQLAIATNLIERKRHIDAPNATD